MEKKVKITTILSMAGFVLLLLPLLYLSCVNRATGDDFGYGLLTKAAWVNTHSLVEVVKAACKTVREYYFSWQGTWFSVFVFTLQPEVFHEKAYVIVPFLTLFLWIGSTYYLFRQVLCSHIGINKWSSRLITICFLMISIEFIPSTKSSIFWYNGCAHYMLPFAMCQMAAAWLLKYSETFQKKYFVGILVFMTLLGGANYQAALLSLIVACYVGLAGLSLKKDKRFLTLLLPVLVELAGLIVSVMAPGNSVREAGNAGSMEQGLVFSGARAIETIGKSFLYAVRDIGKYLREKPLIFVGLVFLFLCFLMSFCMEKEKDGFRFQHPIWLSLMLFCLYSAMQAPAIYADVPVSGGVPNTNFQVFLLTAAGILLILAEKTSAKLKGKWKEQTGKKALQRIVYPGIALCFVLLVFARSGIKTSTSYISLMYIASGEAADYKGQMDLQTELMKADGVEDVVVPFINDVQGPLMHMPVTEDETKFTNSVTAQFYGKRSVIAIERPLWMELYGDTDGKQSGQE